MTTNDHADAMYAAIHDDHDHGYVDPRDVDPLGYFDPTHVAAHDAAHIVARRFGLPIDHVAVIDTMERAGYDLPM
jgi:hypothetical protein